jgi:hypothetical protein
MERGDTVVASKKVGRSNPLNDHEEEDDQEYGEEEGALHGVGTTNEILDKFNIKFLDGNLE